MSKNSQEMKRKQIQRQIESIVRYFITMLSIYLLHTDKSQIWWASAFVLEFFTIFGIIGVVASKIPEIKKAIIRSYIDGYHLPFWADVLFYTVIVTMLIYSGWFLTAIAWWIIGYSDFKSRDYALMGLENKAV